MYERHYNKSCGRYRRDTTPQVFVRGSQFFVMFEIILFFRNDHNVSHDPEIIFGVAD